MGANKARLRIRWDFIVGLPRKTKETAEKSVKFINELELDILQMAVWRRK